MDIGKTVRSARRAHSLSQVELSHVAGVGLATLQNIEANRANPALQTLLAIFKILKIKISLEVETQNVTDNLLALYGCPLKVAGKFETDLSPSRRGLIEITRDLHLNQLTQRRGKAVSAWLEAIRDHYPSLWNEIPMGIRAWAQNQPSQPKLRRIALSRLGQFL